MAQIVEIDRLPSGPGYFEATAPDEVAALTAERTWLQDRVEQLMGAWEQVETEMAEVG